jgi:arginyl-tRNA synthetase
MTAVSLASRIDAALIETFASLDLPVKFARSTASGRADLADRQCNGAMAAAKELDRNPRDVAGAIASALFSRPEFSEISVAGPGFVNMRLSATFLAEVAPAQADDPDLCLAKTAMPERIVVDFGGPNVAKPLHVGHLRSLVIGESLRRILLSCGHHVLSDVHLGDWGLQMGQLISELEIRQPVLPYFDATFAGPYPATPPVTLADLEAMYPAAAKACKTGRDSSEVPRWSRCQQGRVRRQGEALTTAPLTPTARSGEAEVERISRVRGPHQWAREHFDEQTHRILSFLWSQPVAARLFCSPVQDINSCTRRQGPHAGEPQLIA